MANSTMIPGPNLLTLLQTKTSNYLLVFLLLVILLSYVDTSKLSSAIEEIKCDSHFAGVSLWDASGAWLNTNDKGENFVVQVKMF